MKKLIKASAVITALIIAAMSLIIPVSAAGESYLTIVENGITLNCEYNGSSFVTVIGGVTTTYSRTDSPYPY